MVWESLGAFCQTPGRLSYAFPWGVASYHKMPLYHKMPDWWSAAEMVVLLEGSPSSREEIWSSVTMTIGFLVTSLTKALLTRLLNLPKQPALGRLLVVPNFFNLRMMEATVFLGTFNAAESCWYPSPNLCLDTIPSRSFMDNTVDLMALFLLWHALSTVEPYVDRCVPFLIMSNQLNLPQVDSNQVVETSRMINVKWDAPELNWVS